MPLQIWFDGTDAVVEWLHHGAALPVPLRIEAYGTGGERSQAKSISTDQGEYRRIVATASETQDALLWLYGATFEAVVDVTRSQRTVLTFYAYGESTCRSANSSILPCARELLHHFDQWHATYGFASCMEEHYARNLWRWDYWQNGRYATSMLGMEINAYVPGLYWLNYFSRRYISRLQIDVDNICEQLQGVRSPTTHGVIIELFKEPQEWQTHYGRIGRVIRELPNVFSMERVESPAPGMTPAQFVDYILKQAKRWP